MQTTPDSVETWPLHYAMAEKDLYALLIEKYGLEMWKRHAVMECIQYLWRCESKGTYDDDIRKVRVICDRIFAENEKVR